MKIDGLGKIVRNEIFLNFQGVIVDFICEFFKCGSTVSDIVFYSKIIINTSGVVTGGQNHTSDAVTYLFVKSADVG